MNSEITPDDALRAADQLGQREQAETAALERITRERHQLQQHALTEAARWAEEHRHLKKQTEEAAEQAKQWAVVALRLGNPPGDVARETKWSPAWLRRIATAAGLPPAPRGRRSRGPQKRK